MFKRLWKFITKSSNENVTSDSEDYFYNKLTINELRTDEAIINIIEIPFIRNMSIEEKENYRKNLSDEITKASPTCKFVILK
jgi:hypothetical protein